MKPNPFIRLVAIGLVVSLATDTLKGAMSNEPWAMGTSLRIARCTLPVAPSLFTSQALAVEPVLSFLRLPFLMKISPRFAALRTMAAHAIAMLLSGGLMGTVYEEEPSPLSVCLTYLALADTHFKKGELNQAMTNVKIALYGDKNLGVPGLFDLTQSQPHGIVPAIQQQAKQLESEIDRVKHSPFTHLAQNLADSNRPLVLAEELGRRFTYYTPRMRQSTLVLLKQALISLKPVLAMNSDQPVKPEHPIFFFYGFHVMTQGSGDLQGKSISPQEHSALDVIYEESLAAVRRPAMELESDMLYATARSCLTPYFASTVLLVRLLQHPSRQDALRPWWHGQQPELYARALRIMVDGYHDSSAASIDAIFRRDPEMTRALSNFADRLRGSTSPSDQVLLARADLIIKLQNEFSIAGGSPQDRERVFIEAEKLFLQGDTQAALAKITPLATTEPYSWRAYRISEQVGVESLFAEDDLRQHIVALKSEIEAVNSYWQLSEIGNASSIGTASTAYGLAREYERFTPRQRACAVNQLTVKMTEIRAAGPESVEQAERLFTGLRMALPDTLAADMDSLVLKDREPAVMDLVRNCAVVRHPHPDLFVTLLAHRLVPETLLVDLAKVSLDDFRTTIDLIPLRNLFAGNEILPILMRHTKGWEMDFLDDVEGRIRHWDNHINIIPYPNPAGLKNGLRELAENYRKITGQTALAYYAANTWNYPLDDGDSVGLLHDGPVIVKTELYDVTLRRTSAWQLVLRDSQQRIQHTISPNADPLEILVGKNRVAFSIDSDGWVVIRSLGGPGTISVKVPARVEHRSADIIAHNLRLLKTIVRAEPLQPNHDLHLKMDRDGRLFESTRLPQAGDKSVYLTWAAGDQISKTTIFWQVKNSEGEIVPDDIRIQGVHLNLAETIKMYNARLEKVKPDNPDETSGMAMVPGTPGFDAAWAALKQADLSTYLARLWDVLQIVMIDSPLREMGFFEDVMQDAIKRFERPNVDIVQVIRELRNTRNEKGSLWQIGRQSFAKAHPQVFRTQSGDPLNRGHWQDSNTESNVALRRAYDEWLDAALVALEEALAAAQKTLSPDEIRKILTDRIVHLHAEHNLSALILGDRPLAMESRPVYNFSISRVENSTVKPDGLNHLPIHSVDMSQGIVEFTFEITVGDRHSMTEKQAVQFLHERGAVRVRRTTGSGLQSEGDPTGVMDVPLTIESGQLLPHPRYRFRGRFPVASDTARLEFKAYFRNHNGPAWATSDLFSGDHIVCENSLPAQDTLQDAQRLLDNPALYARDQATYAEHLLQELYVLAENDERIGLPVVVRVITQACRLDERSAVKDSDVRRDLRRRLGWILSGWPWSQEMEPAWDALLGVGTDINLVEYNHAIHGLLQTAGVPEKYLLATIHHGLTITEGDHLGHVRQPFLESVRRSLQRCKPPHPLANKIERLLSGEVAHEQRRTLKVVPPPLPEPSPLPAKIALKATDIRRRLLLSGLVSGQVTFAEHVLAELLRDREFANWPPAALGIEASKDQQPITKGTWLFEFINEPKAGTSARVLLVRDVDGQTGTIRAREIARWIHGAGLLPTLVPPSEKEIEIEIPAHRTFRVLATPAEVEALRQEAVETARLWEQAVFERVPPDVTISFEELKNRWGGRVARLYELAEGDVVLIHEGDRYVRSEVQKQTPLGLTSPEAVLRLADRAEKKKLKASERIGTAWLSALVMICIAILSAVTVCAAAYGWASLVVGAMVHTISTYPMDHWLRHKILSRWFAKQTAGILIPEVRDQVPEPVYRSLEGIVQFASQEEVNARLMDLLSATPRLGLTRVLGVGVGDDLPLPELLLSSKRLVLVDKNEKLLQRSIQATMHTLVQLHPPSGMLQTIAKERVQLIKANLSSRLQELRPRAEPIVFDTTSRVQAMQGVLGLLDEFAQIEEWPSLLPFEPGDLLLASLMTSQLITLPMDAIWSELLFRRFHGWTENDVRLFMRESQRLGRSFVKGQARHLADWLLPGGILYWADTYAEYELDRPDRTHPLIPIRAFLKATDAYFDRERLGSWVFKDDEVPDRAANSKYRVAAYKMTLRAA